MKLEDLQNELDQDVKIDFTKLQFEAANNPTLYSKWLRKHSNIRKEILREESIAKKAKKVKLDYYSGRGDDMCMDRYERSEMKTVLEGDADLVKTNARLQYWHILLEFCSGALDAIKSRGFSIKHIQEMRQFEAGQ